MKHHVFFFLLIFSFSAYAMNKNEQKATRIIEICRQMNQLYPGSYNIELLEAGKKELLKLPSVEQKKMLKTARNFVPRYMGELKDPHCFSLKESNGKNEYSGNNTIY